MISSETKQLKNEKTKATRQATTERRLGQECKTYELKIDISHSSKAKKKNLELVFLGAKWLYNNILSQEDITKYDTSVKEVKIKVKDKFELRSLKAMGSQLKQGVHDRLLYSLSSLKAKKEKGSKVGKLKFKSEINSVDLKQHGVTWKFHDVNKQLIHIQGIKGFYKVGGGKQIPAESEFANAKLINRGMCYFIQITCYLPKKEKVFPKKSVGIDFGIESTVTTSDGKKYKVDIPETNYIKNLQRSLARKRRVNGKNNKKTGKKTVRKHTAKKNYQKSNNYKKVQALLGKAYEKINCQKKDIKNKIVSEIVNTYETVSIQDDSIKSWQEGWFGSKVQRSVLGGIKRDLMRKSHTLKLIDRYTPTTDVCLGCLSINEIELKDRTYNCSKCAYTEDRDTHSAQATDELGLGKLIFSTVDREFKRPD